MANGVVRITIVPTGRHDAATFEFLDGSNSALHDADSVADDLQVDLDVGANTVKVEVTAEDGVTTETYTMVVTRAVANNSATGQPGIIGTPQVGQTLTATLGDMADDDNLPQTTFPTGYSFQWVRVDSGSNETDIGTDSQTYTPVAADVGDTIKVKVSFTDGGGTEETLVSAATAAVVAEQEDCASERSDADWCATMTVGKTGVGVSAEFGFDVSPTFGSLDDAIIDYAGETLTIQHLKIAGDTIGIDFVEPHAPARFGVRFRRGPSSPPTAASRRATTGLHTWDRPANLAWIEGQKVTVSANLPPLLTAATVDGDELVLTYSEDLDTPGPAQSAFSVKVDGGAGAAPSGVDISGDEVTLTLAAAVTSGQTVTVSYTKPGPNPLRDESGLEAAGFTDESVTNNTASAVANAAGQPGITGTPQVGQTLTATLGTIQDADGLPSIFPDDYSLRWVRVNSLNDETEISGATSGTYDLVTADLGHTLKVKVSFTDDGGTAEGPLVSDAYPSTGTVAAASLPGQVTGAERRCDRQQRDAELDGAFGHNSRLPDRGLLRRRFIMG